MMNFSTAPHADFRPPTDLAGALFTMKLSLSLKFALHGKINIRNLEHHWYGFDSKFLDCLVANHQRMLVIPQHYLWASHDELGGMDDNDSSQPSDDSLPEISFLSTARTVRGDAACALAPDFTIVHVPYRRATMIPGEPFWKRFTIRGVSIPVIWERKRRPPRHLKLEQMMGSRGPKTHLLHRIFRTAETALLNQASLAFHRCQNQQFVLLIATVGEFWAHRFIGRDTRDLPDPHDLAGVFQYGPGEDDLEALDEDQFEDQDFDNGDEDSGESDDDLDIMDMPEGTDTGLEAICRNKQEVKDMWKRQRKQLCSPILYGTPTSNQREYMVHQYLLAVDKNEINDGWVPPL